MAFWSREILLLLVVAVLASLCGPAHGFIFDRVSRNENAAAGSGGSGGSPGSGGPATEMSVGCVCDDPPALACHCGVGIDANILGNRIAFQPKVNVEFIPKNVSLVMSVTNQDQNIYSRVIAGEKFIPPVCIPVPQFPLVGLCVEFSNLSCDLENKTVSFCTVLGVNTMPVGLPMHPSMPVGCFTAGEKDGLKYTAPELKIPGKEQVDKMIANIAGIPSSLDQWSPFGGMKEAVGWPFGKSAAAAAQQQADKPQADINAPAAAGADNEDNTNAPAPPPPALAAYYVA